MYWLPTVFKNECNKWWRYLCWNNSDIVVILFKCMEKGYLTHPFILRCTLWLSTSRKRWNLSSKPTIVTRLPFVYMLAANMLCSLYPLQRANYLKFDQANFTASWKFWSLSSSTPLIHRISFLVSFSVSFSNSVQCAMVMLSLCAAVILMLHDLHVAFWCLIVQATVQQLR